METPDSRSSASPLPRFIVLVGPLEGRTFPIAEGPFSIGRKSSSDLKLYHESVSRHHCTVHRTAQKALLQDHDSLCGTYVNGVAIRNRTLEHGDIVKVGDTLLLFSSQPDRPDSRIRPGTGDFLDSSRDLQSTLELPVAEGQYLQPLRLEALLRERDAMARHLGALLELSIELQTENDSMQVVQRLAEMALRATPADRVVVLGSEPEGFPLFHTARRSGADAMPGISRSLCQRVFRRQVAVLSNDTADNPDLADFESLEGTDRSILCLPLAALGLSIGLLYADADPGSYPFEREHLEVLLAAAGITALALQQARQTEALQAEARRLRSVELDHDILGESPAIERALQLTSRVAPTDLTVLIRGESGTGKELFAKALHRSSPRREKPFVAINCATLSETLLESELFGHEKGSFTGAIARKIGQLERADRGTLFLDEIGEIPVALQAKLLRALEAREIQRIGGKQPIPVDVRILAATNRDLEAAIEAGRFRDDLFHRLNVFALTLPPLRDRQGDVLLLANHFAARSAQSLGRASIGFTSDARSALLGYDWPGNVRELRNAMERAAVLSTNASIGLEDLPDAVVERFVSGAEPTQGYHDAVTRAKRQILLEALESSGGNPSQAARQLRLNRTYFHRLLTNLGVR